MKKENLIGLGVFLLILSLFVFVFAEIPAKTENYVLKDSVDNSNTPFRFSLSGYYEAGQTLFFNFTKGSYWGVKYDVENGGLEPSISDFGQNTSLPEHKIVTFYLHTPTSNIGIDVYVVSGTDPFAVVYLNESNDFAPITGGNLSFVNLGVEGTINTPGTYSMQASAVVPLILRAENDSYTLATNPPALMRLWNVNFLETTPYFVPSVLLGATLVISGTCSCIWAVSSRRRQRRHSMRKSR
jgi:hypothetical protein